MRLGWLILVTAVLAGVACESQDAPTPASQGFLTLTEAEAIGLVQSELSTRPIAGNSCMRPQVINGDWTARRTDVANTWLVEVRFTNSGRWGPWTVFERTGAVATQSGVC